MRHVLGSRHWREGLVLMRVSSILTHRLIKAWSIRCSVVIVGIVMLTHGINKWGLIVLLLLLLLLMVSVAVREWILLILIIDSTAGSSVASHWSCTMTILFVLLTLLLQFALLTQAMLIQSLLNQALFLPEIDAGDCQCYQP